MHLNNPKIYRRFFKGLKLDLATGCWLPSNWAKDDYARITLYLSGGPRIFFRHRLAFILFHGPIPRGLEIHHRCGVKPCCNPLHLEALTASENVRRALASRPPQCPKGHPLSGLNLMVFINRGAVARVCRTCRNDALARAQSPSAPFPSSIASEDPFYNWTVK